MRHLALSTMGLGAVLAAVACGGAAGVSTGNVTGTTKQPLEALVPLAGCNEVEAYVRDRMIAETNRYFDAVRKSIDESQGYGCYYGGYGEGDYNGAPTSAGAPSGGSSSGSSSSSGGGAPPPAAPADKASQTSGTNNQVAGVDEADFVKNDGTYLYVAANKALRIVKAWPANEAASVAKVPLDGEPRKLFVEGDRAIVYVAVQPPPSTSGASSPPSYGGYRSGECTYGYDCVPSGDGTQTKIEIFDIGNRAAPTKLREISLSGSLLAARRIGDAVHTVVVDAPIAIDGLEWYPADYRCDSSLDPATQKAQTIAAYEALRAANIAKINAADVRSKLPSIQDGTAAAPQCTGYFRPSLADGRSFTTLVSFDVAGGAPTSATVVSDPGVVYASETALYMSVPHDKNPDGVWYDSMADEEQASTVHRFRIGEAPSLTGYQTSGIVKGRVLNQFSLDEWQDHLRVATTSGHTPDPKVHSTMSVLERQGNALVLTGKVDNIAPTEDIRSVRFDGSRGFVVTFKKTDPLYAFDLGNPYKPSIAGELKIPGFSTYMHMMDAQHLLTIGYDADDQGSFAWFAGVRLQIFDVSDMKNPQLAHSTVIGTRGSSSEALTDHLAFTYFAQKNLLALPMTICEGGSGGSYGTTMTFAGLMVYDTTVANGFQLKGKVSHPQTTSGGYDDSACTNWWTQASSEVKRSVFMDDFVYSISDKRVKVNALSNLSVDLANIALDD